MFIVWQSGMAFRVPYALGRVLWIGETEACTTPTLLLAAGDSVMSYPQRIDCLA